MASAYDYTLQRWIIGDEARALLISQLSETLAILESSKGREYAAFINVNQVEFTENTRRQLAKLSAAVGE